MSFKINRRPRRRMEEVPRTSLYIQDNIDGSKSKGVSPSEANMVVMALVVLTQGSAMREIRCDHQRRTA